MYSSGSVAAIFSTMFLIRTARTRRRMVFSVFWSRMGREIHNLRLRLSEFFATKWQGQGGPKVMEAEVVGTGLKVGDLHLP